MVLPRFDAQLVSRVVHHHRLLLEDLFGLGAEDVQLQANDVPFFEVFDPAYALDSLDLLLAQGLHLADGVLEAHVIAFEAGDGRHVLSSPCQVAQVLLALLANVFSEAR
eukprot:CAMPEP_0170489280 /NCGR_PEP_ID=MMETSP0208-20121228/7651_1 /TAXON_ID=197538 /ORGANISM="Strombidium inclinatum, Strain S3" /LENGTH=108 /DNA_ID=CAMNT_0010764127 /DNA_START=257 /DNA_END=579 /DNA_ORIENTATION=+